MIRIAIVVAAIALCQPAVAADDSVDNAFALCAMMDGTGLASQPCKVSGWDRQVQVSLDMASGEARSLCTQVAGLMRDRGKIFAPGWTLHIRSPYSDGNSIAFCGL